MGIVFRQSIKTSLVIFAGAVLGALTIWVYTKYLPKQQFGYLRNITSQSVALSNFLLLGTGHLLIVYIHKYVNEVKKRNLILTICLLVPLVTTTLCTFLYFAFPNLFLRGANPDDVLLMRRYFIWLPIYCLISIYVIMLELYLGTQMKVAISAFMREIVVRLVNIIVIFLFVFGYINFSTLVGLTVLINAIPIIIFLFLSFNTEAFRFSLSFKNFSKAEYKEIISFSFYHFLFIVSSIFMATLDVLALPYLDKNGLSSVAIYNVAILLISFMQIPAKGMQTATYTVLAKAITSNDTVQAKKIFEKSAINMFIATIGVALVICCNLDNAIVISNKGYYAAIPVFLILLCGRIVDVSTGVNDIILSITNHYKFNFLLSVLGICTLILLLKYLVPIYGINGAAISTSISLILFNTGKFLFVRKKLNMQPFSKGTLLVLAAAVPALAGGYFFPHFFSQMHHLYINTFIDVIIRSSIIIIIYLAMLLWLKPSPDLEEYLASVRKNKRLF